jgi:hypothetical protein
VSEGRGTGATAHECASVAVVGAALDLTSRSTRFRLHGSEGSVPISGPPVQIPRELTRDTTLATEVAPAP